MFNFGGIQKASTLRLPICTRCKGYIEPHEKLENIVEVAENGALLIFPFHDVCSPKYQQDKLGDDILA